MIPNPDRTIIVTGGNAGLGFACAEHLARSRAGHVIIASRDAERGEKAVQALKAAADFPYIEQLPLDLASLASVRAFARKLAERDDLPPLRGLICNAGLQVVRGTQATEDGFELTFGVNHLGHYLLTHLLLKHLHAPARIIFVSSGTHDPKQRTGMPAPSYPGAMALAYPEQNLDPGERSGGGTSVGLKRYTTSKLCNIYTTYELERRLAAANVTGITVNAFDPGAMAKTGLTREWSSLARWAADTVVPPLVPVARRFGISWLSTPQISGRALAGLATSSQFAAVTGRYFTHDREMRSSDLSYDQDNARELWRTSARLVGLEPEDTIFPTESLDDVRVA